MSVKKLAALSVLSCALASQRPRSRTAAECELSSHRHTDHIDRVGLLAGYSLGASDVGTALDFAWASASPTGYRRSSSLSRATASSTPTASSASLRDRAASRRNDLTRRRHRLRRYGGLSMYYSLVSRNVSGSLQTNSSSGWATSRPWPTLPRAACTSAGAALGFYGGY